MRIAPGSKPHHLPSVGRGYGQKKESYRGARKNEGAEGGRALAELSFAWPDLVQPKDESLLSKKSIGPAANLLVLAARWSRPHARHA